MIETRQMASHSGVELDVHTFALTEYADAHQAMVAFTNTRERETRDQIWLIEHPPVYTQGTACTHNTLLPSDIPVVKTDRGGQITYHGPGQVVMYPLLRLKNFGLGVKALVFNLEQSVIDTLAEYDITARRRDNAPGVYVTKGDEEAKIGALGLRIRRGNSYHGLSLNVQMDLSPFGNIDPCGYRGMQVAELADFVTPAPPLEVVATTLTKRFLQLV